MELCIRETFTYVGTCKHLDKWRFVGHADELTRRLLPLPDDEEDMCEPKREEAFVLVKPDEGVTDDVIQAALRDHYTSHGCAHEWDCCGCRSYSASAEKKTGDLWRVEINSSRNF